MSFHIKPKTPDEALLHLTDCTLATVEHMLDLTRPPKGETSRQIEMAQDAVSVIMDAKMDVSGQSRIRAIIETSNGRVAEHYGWQVN